MAAFGNTNISARPYAPTDYSKQPSGQNPYGYGYQRVAGQLAPQRPAQGYDANFMAGAQVGRLPRQIGYGPQTSVPPQMPGNVSYQPMPQQQPTPGYMAQGYTPLILQDWQAANPGGTNDQFIAAQHAGFAASQAGKPAGSTAQSGWHNPYQTPEQYAAYQATGAQNLGAPSWAAYNQAKYGQGQGGATIDANGQYVAGGQPPAVPTTTPEPWKYGYP